MKLFKVTYERMCHPSRGVFLEEHEAYYTCSSLDRLYDYIENEQHLNVVSIKILKFTEVKPKTLLPTGNQEFKTINSNEATIIKAM